MALALALAPLRAAQLGDIVRPPLVLVHHHDIYHQRNPSCNRSGARGGYCAPPPHRFDLQRHDTSNVQRYFRSDLLLLYPHHGMTTYSNAVLCAVYVYTLLSPQKNKLSTCIKIIKF